MNLGEFFSGRTLVLTGFLALGLENKVRKILAITFDSKL
jgi:hypothetical protein